MKKEIFNLAKKELARLSFPSDRMSQSVEEDDRELRRMFRNEKYFTSNEEDDDFPEFTGQQEALAYAKRRFSEEVLENFELSVQDGGEKSWFLVVLSPK